MDRRGQPSRRLSVADFASAEVNLVVTKERQQLVHCTVHAITPYGAEVGGTYFGSLADNSRCSHVDPVSVLLAPSLVVSHQLCFDFLYSPPSGGGSRNEGKRTASDYGLPGPVLFRMGLGTLVSLVPFQYMVALAVGLQLRLLLQGGNSFSFVFSSARQPVLDAYSAAAKSSWLTVGSFVVVMSCSAP